MNCTHCGVNNPKQSKFCTECGEPLSMAQKSKRRFIEPSNKMIALVIGIIFVAGIFVKLGTTFFTGQTTAASVSNSVKVDEAQVIAVAKNFKCACGGCGELPLATCECNMAKGAVEQKRFIREKLAEGITVEQVIELVDQKYGHRV